MINIIKNLNFGGVVALVAMMVLTVSWTSSEKMVADTGWYPIEAVGPNFEASPSDQKITSPTGNPAEPTGDCAVNNDGPRCQVHLDLTNFSSSTPIEDMTVQDALNAGATITNGGTSSPDGYAREDL